jgi:hypothetical protein
MTEEDIRKRAFAMPLTNAAYPRLLDVRIGGTMDMPRVQAEVRF